ncbi:MAG: dihydroorotase [Betaproteobacteria bacterium]|nr:dihydroorotase [Betaproteobacteria bacterium]
MRVSIANGMIVDPVNRVERPGDVAIDGEHIVAAGQLPAGFKPDRTIDASGLVVAPGFVDLAARLREPGFEYKATLASELHAAVAGGITTLVCPPDTDPPLDEPGLVEMLKRRAANLSLAHVHPLGALTAKLEGERLAELNVLAEAGCVAFSQGDVPLVDTLLLWRALQYAATFKFGVWLRPQDSFLAKNGVAHDGEVATRLGLPGIPTIAETIAITTILRLVRESGARVHICRISSAESVQLIREAKQAGLSITCDVAIHHLHCTDADIGFFDSHFHVVPPFRTQRDREVLCAALADGTIDALCSDHTPVDEDAKQIPFGESEPGATGLELLLPLTLKWAKESKLSMSQALAAITSAPARLLGLDAGTLSPAARADICVFDPEAMVRITPQSLRSQGKNTPFLGCELAGTVRYTLVNGAVVYSGR